ncbi:MAG: hypothetical protein RR585_03755 [Coprobacillus sp.]
MSKNKITLVVLGALVYMIVSLIDRFVISIDDIIYVPVVMGAILMMLIGIIKQGQD